jgi:hypothetical protein
MHVLSPNELLQYQVPDLKLSWDNTLIVVLLQGFLVLWHVG